jgi:TnpA family transposase
LNKYAKNRIRKDIIARYWDDMIRVAGSLKLGAVNPIQLIRMLQRGGKPTMFLSYSLSLIPVFRSITTQRPNRTVTLLNGLVR